MSNVRQRAIAWEAPAPAPATMSGLEAVQAVAAGLLPPPPFAVLVGLGLAQAEAGRVSMTLHPAEFHYNPIGSVHGGIIATLLETVLAGAIRSTLPAGRSCVTLEIKVNYVRAVTEAAGLVTGEGRVVQAGRQVALAEGRVTDANGRLYATASSTCLVTDVAPPPVAPPGVERRRVTEWADPVAGARALAGLPGLAALQGRRAAIPVAALVGMEMGALGPGKATMRLPPGEHLFSQFGAVHGGMIAVLVDSVLGCAVHTTLAAGRGYTTLELKLSFLRPVTAESGVLTATGQVLHAGRRMATAEARAVDQAGRLCATGTTTCLVFDAQRPA